MSARTLKVTVNEPVASHVVATITALNAPSFKGAEPHASSADAKTLTFEFEDSEGIQSKEGQWKAALECIVDGFANVLRLEGVDANFPH